MFLLLETTDHLLLEGVISGGNFGASDRDFSVRLQVAPKAIPIGSVGEHSVEPQHHREADNDGQRAEE